MVKKKLTREEKFENFKKQLFEYWVKEKNGLGLKRQQFILEMKKTNINFILRKLRKQKVVFFKTKRWWITKKIFDEFKGVGG